MPPTGPRGCRCAHPSILSVRSSGSTPIAPGGATARGRPGRKRPFRGAGNCATSPRRAAGGGQQSWQTGCRQGRGSNRGGLQRCRLRPPSPTLDSARVGDPHRPSGTTARRLGGPRRLGAARAPRPQATGPGRPFRGAGNCATSPRRSAVGGGGLGGRVAVAGAAPSGRAATGAARARPCRPKRHDCPRPAGAGCLFRGAGNCATSHGPPAPDALGGQAPSARPSARRNPSVVSLSRTARRSHSSSRPGNVSPRRVA